MIDSRFMGEQPLQPKHLTAETAAKLAFNASRGEVFDVVDNAGRLVLSMSDGFSSLARESLTDELAAEEGAELLLDDDKWALPYVERD